MQLVLMLVLLRFTNRLLESKHMGKGILKSHYVQCFPFQEKISNITYYHLKWPGIVENSTGKKKK